MGDWITIVGVAGACLAAFAVLYWWTRDLVMVVLLFTGLYLVSMIATTVWLAFNEMDAAGVMDRE